MRRLNRLHDSAGGLTVLVMLSPFSPYRPSTAARVAQARDLSRTVIFEPGVITNERPIFGFTLGFGPSLLVGQMGEVGDLP